MITKRLLFPLLLLTSWIVIGVTAISFYAPNYSSVPPQGYTGVTGIYCTNCHSGNSLNSIGGSVSVSGLPSVSYTASSVYNFSITVSHAVANRRRWGFSIIAVNAAGNAVGTFSTTNLNAAVNGNELSHNIAVLTSLQSSYTYTNLTWTAPASTSGDNGTIKFYYVGNATDGSGTSLGDFIYSGLLTVSAPIAPVINNPSPSSLSGFNYSSGAGPSSEQSFSVSASNLSADAIITAPANYEVSKTSGSGFAPSIVLTPISGSVSNATVYVRLKSGLLIGSYNGNISITSAGANSQTVICAGNVSTAPPCSTNYWTGAVSSAWEDSNNWSCGSLPDVNTIVYVNGSIANYPVVNSMATCKTIYTASGVTVVVNAGYKLDVTGQ